MRAMKTEHTATDSLPVDDIVSPVTVRFFPGLKFVDIEQGRYLLPNVRVV